MFEERVNDVNYTMIDNLYTHRTGDTPEFSKRSYYTITPKCYLIMSIKHVTACI